MKGYKDIKPGLKERLSAVGTTFEDAVYGLAVWIAKDEEEKVRPYWKKGLWTGCAVGIFLAMYSFIIFMEQRIAYFNGPFCAVLGSDPTSSACTSIVLPVILIIELSLVGAVAGMLAGLWGKDGVSGLRTGCVVGVASGILLAVNPGDSLSMLFYRLQNLAYVPFALVLCLTGVFCIGHGGEAIVLYLAPVTFPVSCSIVGAVIGWLYGRRHTAPEE